MALGREDAGVLGLWYGAQEQRLIANAPNRMMEFTLSEYSVNGPIGAPNEAVGKASRQILWRGNLPSNGG